MTANDQINSIERMIAVPRDSHPMRSQSSRGLNETEPGVENACVVAESQLNTKLVPRNTKMRASNVVPVTARTQHAARNRRAFICARKKIFGRKKFRRTRIEVIPIAINAIEETRSTVTMGKGK